ncbi:hypothetical protein M3Y99_00247500 [Aphelenchoides fujianensis]|nr:hypothetical protein M3Y99_00247500 [Aphelenchoides fujianensis]
MQSSAFVAALLLGSLLIVSAGPLSEEAAGGPRGHHGPGGGPHGGPPHPPPGGPMLGPLGPLVRNLTDEQRQTLFSTLRDSRNDTKGEIKTKIQAFVKTLSADQQEQVAEFKARMDEHKANDTARVSSLSSEAQTLFKNIQASSSAAVEDDSLTPDETRQKVDALVQAAPQSVKDEFRNNRIPVPGIPPPPPKGGSHQSASASASSELDN